MIPFSVANFRLLFPAFANTTTFPDATITAYATTARGYIGDNNYGWYCGSANAAQQIQLLNLMTAHLLALGTATASGGGTGVVTDAKVGAVSVTLLAPPAKNAWQYWLNSSPYGQQLLALLELISAGGYYAGPRPELSAFRRAGFR